MYTDKPFVFSTLIDTKSRADSSSTIADNVDIDYFIVPAGREIQIQNMRAYVEELDADAEIELVKEDNTILCRILLAATGHVSALQSTGSTAQTFPITVAPQSATLPKLIKLRTAGALDATTKAMIQVHVSGLNHR